MAYLRDYQVRGFINQELRDAVYARLTSEITDVVVWDGTAPPDADYPLIIIGGARNADASSKTNYADDIVLTIDVFTHEPAYVKNTMISQEILKWISQGPLYVDDSWFVTGVKLDTPSLIQMRDAFAARAHGILMLRFTVRNNGE
ncbi:MAG: hypothetical protein WCE94_15215 [Candidatus Methanoperedens sp.]